VCFPRASQTLVAARKIGSGRAAWMCREEAERLKSGRLAVSSAGALIKMEGVRPAFWFLMLLTFGSFARRVSHFCPSFRCFAAVAVPFTSPVDCPFIFFCGSLNHCLSPRDIFVRCIISASLSSTTSSQLSTTRSITFQDEDSVYASCGFGLGARCARSHCLHRLLR
jgi:hypothetical protein